MLLTTDSINKGDWVQIGSGNTGEVISQGLAITSLKTRSGDIIDLPNDTILNSKIHVDQVNECINTAFNKNIIEAKAGGNITVRAINQKITSNAAADCMSDTINKTLRESEALQKAITDLKMLEYTQKAAMQVAGRILQPTLLDFLR